MLEPIKNSDWNQEKAAHLLNRTGFGAKPEEIERLAQMRPREAVDYVVDYEKIPDPTPKPKWAELDPNLHKEWKAMRMLSGAEKETQRRRMRREQRRQVQDLRHWWLERMTAGPRPLQEKMTLFWHGHFATSIQKVKQPYLMYKQNEIFRQNATGKWLDLLTEASKDPAMLIWLDGARSNRKKPNENFAREVMELFTLGEGNYSEEDIREAARAFTGWSLARNRQEFTYRERMHDPGSKRFFGRNGKFKGEDILEILVKQDQASKFITSKLWRFFVSESLSPRMQDELAIRFAAHRQVFAPWLKEVFVSREFYAPDVMRRQIKSPVQWLTSTVRNLNRPLPPTIVSQQMLSQLGQNLFEPPNVKGWDGGTAWINTNHLLSRYNFAKDLVEGRGGKRQDADAHAMRKMTKGEPKGREAMMERLMKSRLARMEPVDVSQLLPEFKETPPDQLLTRLEEHFLSIPLKPSRRQTLATYLQQHPQLNENSLRRAIRLLMCTPEYQLT